MKTFIRDILIFVVILLGCFLFYKHSGFFLYEHNTMQYMPNMYRTPAYLPFRASEFFKDGSGARVPPEGTLSVHENVYPYSAETLADKIPAKANPLPKTKEVLEDGRFLYMTYCVVCHGETGAGKGYVVPPFPQPPTLHSDKIRDYADSQIYHVITVGQNSMMAYASQVRPMDRWAIIHYIRALQLAQNPSDKEYQDYEDSQTKGGN